MQVQLSLLNFCTGVFSSSNPKNKAINLVLNNIEITLPPVYLKNDYLYVPAALKSFFPPGKPLTTHRITIETASGNFTAELQFNSRGYI